uniref:Uncharacterized protein n=1 Tax=Lepeophtheirus salmonis TaxID=72036 RepID=A0A0K2SW50_LEPSM
MLVSIAVNRSWIRLTIFSFISQNTSLIGMLESMILGEYTVVLSPSDFLIVTSTSITRLLKFSS